MLGGVVRILDLDAQLLTDTIVQGARIVPSQVTITQITPGGATYVAWISREDQLFNVPLFAGLDLNADGDNLDFVVMIMAYKGVPGPGVAGDMWAFVPLASAGFSTGYRAVHMTGEIMVVEQGLPIPVLFTPATLPPTAPASPILVFDLQGFAVLQLFFPGGTVMPNPIPSPASGGAGYVPKANFRSGLVFPQSGYIVYEQREIDLGADANADGDQCDRVVAFQQITGINTACPLGLVCPPAFGTVSVTLSAPCQMGVGNFPSARPDATFGQYVGFDVLPSAQQPTFGPDCPPPPTGTNHSHRGRANPINSAACASGYSLGNNMIGESVSVAGPIFAHVVRENATGVGDQNGDGFADPGLVVWINQTTWPPTMRWFVIGPGNNPSAENVLNFVINPPAGGPFLGLTAYAGFEAYFSLGDLNGDGDQGDEVIMIHLR